MLFVILSIAIMVLDYRENHLDAARQVLSVAVQPIRVAVDFPFAASAWLMEAGRDRQALRTENEELRDAQLLNRVRLQQFAALEAENARLRSLMDSTAKVADRVLITEILSVDLDPLRHRIALDKGLRHGAFAGQALLDADGVVGQITRTGPLNSEAILISDPDHAVPVEVNRNGLRTIVVGTGDTTVISLPFLPTNADIEEGDLLVTSGMGGTFPRGYPVAVIKSISRDPHQPFAAIEAIPSAALNQNREVLLVWSGEQLARNKMDNTTEQEAGSYSATVGGAPN
ncbi:MAG: rod shape-determining protein MreC [Gammaproteobacteria bacterium]|nr:rod shape-determining protein MreC [Gammaproteobacteria bacterium]